MNIEPTSFTRTFVIINQHPENQHDFMRKRVGPEERLYNDTLNETKSKRNRK